MSDERALTIKQPYASLIVAGIKDVENRSWPVPSTLPQWWRCMDQGCSARWYNGDLLHCDRGTADGLFPFRLWIHAGLSAEGLPPGRREGGAFVADGRAYVGRSGSGPFWYPTSRNDFATRPLPLGVLLGSVLVTGCHWSDECRTAKPWVHSEGVIIGHCSPWADEDAYHWTLADPQPLPEPIPMKGRQGLWRVPHSSGGFLVGSSSPSTPSTSTD